MLDCENYQPTYSDFGVVWRWKVSRRSSSTETAEIIIGDQFLFSLSRDLSTAENYNFLSLRDKVSQTWILNVIMGGGD